jgi:hypothetical protein
MEVELEPLAFHDMEKLEVRIQEAFGICRQAVDDELTRHQASEPYFAPATNSEAQTVPSSVPSPPVRSGNPIVPLATERQVEFAYHLAREIRSLGGQRLPLLVEQLYGRSLAELNTAECSKLIGLLKELRSGARSVDELLASSAA